MNEPITVTYDVDPALTRRAMVAWTRKPKPRAARIRQTLLGILAWVVIAAGTYVLLDRDAVSRDLVVFLVGMVAGVGVILGVWWLIHLRQSATLADMAAAQARLAGPRRAVFAADGVTFTSRLGRSDMTWLGFDAADPFKGGTALRSGAMVYAIPDDALPSGISPEEFRTTLTRRIEAAR